MTRDLGPRLREEKRCVIAINSANSDVCVIAALIGSLIVDP